MKFQSRSLTPDRSARHFYGGELRRYRANAGMSLMQLADIVSSSKSTLARVENAEIMPPPGLSEALDAAFGLDGLFAGIYGLARREGHPDRYRRYMDFEAVAVEIENYAAHVVPGLLQTEPYARALLQCQPGLSQDDVDQRVAARMSRQERLRSVGRPYVWAILDEAVIRRPIRSPEVMYGQLSALLRQVDAPHAKVQVLPYSNGEHPFLGGSLTLLTVPDGDAVAYEEGIEAGFLYEDPEAVQKRRRLYDVLRANALSLPETAALIKHVMEEYAPCKPPT